MALLEDIVNNKRQEIDDRKKKIKVEELKEIVGSQPSPCNSLKTSIDETRKKYGFAIIGEIKSKSPSMADMKPENVDKALAVYNDSSVIAGISVLTDLKYFGQGTSFLEKFRKKTSKPILRKDFIIDTYQVWEAKAKKADAILLMSTLHKDNINQFYKIYELAKKLNLEVLIEFGMDMPPHKDFIPSSAHLIGINSREFKGINAIKKTVSSTILSKDLSTKKATHINFYKQLESVAGTDYTVIAESGINQPNELDQLVETGYSGALIGTAFLKEGDVQTTVNNFYNYIASHKAHSVNYKFA